MTPFSSARGLEKNSQQLTTHSLAGSSYDYSYRLAAYKVASNSGPTPTPWFSGTADQASKADFAPAYLVRSGPSSCHESKAGGTPTYYSHCICSIVLPYILILTFLNVISVSILTLSVYAQYTYLQTAETVCKICKTALAPALRRSRLAARHGSAGFFDGVADASRGRDRLGPPFWGAYGPRIRNSTRERALGLREVPRRPLTGRPASTGLRIIASYPVSAWTLHPCAARYNLSKWHESLARITDCWRQH